MSPTVAVALGIGDGSSSILLPSIMLLHLQGFCARHQRKTECLQLVFDQADQWEGEMRQEDL